MEDNQSTAPPILLGLRKLTSIDDLEDGKYYAKSELSGIILWNGRRLIEALSNDPLAPPPCHEGRLTYNSKEYTKGQIFDYVAKAKQDEMISEKFAAMLTRAQERASKIREKAIADASLIRQEQRNIINEARRAAVDLIVSAVQAKTFTAHHVPEIPSVGVYFLLQGRKIVYVGQSTNVFSRIATHRLNGKTYDSVIVMRCNKEELNCYEGMFIRLLEPEMNGVQAAPRSELWERFSKFIFPEEQDEE